MEGRFLDNIFNAFELDLPRDIDTMENALKFILPKIKPWGGSIKDTSLWLGPRFLEIHGTDAWDKSFIHIFQETGEHLIFDTGVMTKRNWNVLGPSLLLEEGGRTIMYDVEYINETFIILKQNSTNRYFVLGSESFVRKINFNWRDAMEELYNVYRHNSRFSMWIMLIIALVVLFFGYIYT